MNASTQNKLWECIQQLSHKYPEWRFGQLVANLADWADQNLWDIDDEGLLKSAQEHLAQSSQPAAEVHAKSA